MRAPTKFEHDVMRARSFVIGAALAAIAAGVAAFVIGLRQPIERPAATDTVVQVVPH
jgi:hypothetical protein